MTAHRWSTFGKVAKKVGFATSHRALQMSTRTKLRCAPCPWQGNYSGVWHYLTLSKDFTSCPYLCRGLLPHAQARATLPLTRSDKFAFVCPPCSPGLVQVISRRRHPMLTGMRHLCAEGHTSLARMQLGRQAVAGPRPLSGGGHPASPRTGPTGAYCPNAGMQEPLYCWNGTCASIVEKRVQWLRRPRVAGMSSPPLDRTSSLLFVLSRLKFKGAHLWYRYNAIKGTQTNASCLGCPSGKYNNGVGLSSCLSCPAGKFTDSPGQTSCKSCDAGGYCETEGADTSMVWLPCAAGFWSAVTGLNSSSGCVACPPGTGQPTLGATSSASCLPCARGTASSASNTSICPQCAKGKYANVTGMADCVLCTDGVCPVGSSAQLPCAAGRYADGDLSQLESVEDCPACNRSM